jgi:hypothetical protein
MARWQGQHDQIMYCRRAPHDQEQRIIWQAGTRRVTSTELALMPRAINMEDQNSPRNNT